MAEEQPQDQEPGSPVVQVPTAPTGRAQASKRKAMMNTVSWAQLSAMYGDELIEKNQGTPDQRRTTWAPSRVSPLVSEPPVEEPPGTKHFERSFVVPN